MASDKASNARDLCLGLNGHENNVGESRPRTKTSLPDIPVQVLRTKYIIVKRKKYALTSLLSHDSAGIL